MIWLPTIEQVLRIHDRLIERTGGSSGLRDVGLVESAIIRASAGYDDVELYPSTSQKAAAVGLGLICNHGFVDGNKRVGVVVMLLILTKNGIDLSYTQQELIDLGLNAAQGKLAVADVANWIERHAVPSDRK